MSLRTVGAGLLCALVALLLIDVALCQVAITVNWTSVIRTSRSTPTCQVVVNPLIARGSPIHDAVYKSINELGAEHIRYVPWFPYPRLGVAEKDRPSGLTQCVTVGEHATATLDCSGPTGKGVIDQIQYASFGTVTSYCGGFVTGKCNANTSVDVVTSACVGKPSCAILANQSIFGNPCVGTPGVRLAIQATCNPPMNNTYWDFTNINPLMEDFMGATEGHYRIINFSTQPNWMYYQDATSGYYPDDPLGIDWGYPSGNQIFDPTAEEIGSYYGRLLAYYTNGGFIDEYGRQVSSPYHYKIDAWEVLNELEHGTDAKTYVTIYDSVVKHIQAIGDPTGDMEFVGMALGSVDLNFINYFLNSSHHAPGVPLDWISYHHYSSSASRTNPLDYEHFFPDYDGFVDTVIQVEKLRMSLSPNTRTTIDEIGVILPNDNDADAAPFPRVYWNAAASSYAYLYAKLSVVGIDVLGSSQLMGYPQLNAMDRLLPAQYPSVSLLNWTTGAGTPRYWALHMIKQHFGPGDQIITTTLSDTSDVFAQAYVGGVVGFQRVLVMSKRVAAVTVVIKGMTGGTALIVDELSGDGPARPVPLTSDILTLNSWAVVVVIMPRTSHTTQAA